MAEQGRPRRRWPWIAGTVLVAAVALRALLPWAARAALENALSDATRSRVSIADVDLGLLRGFLRVEEIAFRDAAPVADETAPEGAASAADTPAPSPPWLAAKRFEVRIGWTALWRRTLRVRSLLLVEPQLSVSRLEGGGLDLPPLRGEPEAAEDAQPEEVAPEPSGEPWALVVDLASLRDGRVRFRDANIAASAPVELDIEEIALEQLALRDRAYEEPARLAAEATIEGAPLRLEASLQGVAAPSSGPEDAEAAASGWTVGAKLDAEGVPIHRVRFYLSPRYAPSRHWAELDGALDLDLRYAFEPGADHTIEGGGALRDVVVHVEGDGDADSREVLSWRRLGVEARAIDLRERRVDLAEVALEGARLLVRTGRGAGLPLLASRDAAPPQPDVAAAPPAEPGSGEDAGGGSDAAAAGDEPAWSGSLAALRVSDSTLELVDAEGTSEAWSLEASAEDLGPDADFPVRLELVREQARIAADGRLRAIPPGGSAEIRLEGLPLRELARHTTGGVPALRGGTLGGRLQLETAREAEPRLELSGTLGVADARVEADDAEAFALRWQELAAELERVVVPLGGDAPPEIALASLRAVAPQLRLRRTAQGFQLPAFSGDAEGEAPARSAGNGAAPPRVRVGRVEIARADVRLEDRSVEPFVRHVLSGARASASDVRWPDLRARELSGELPGLGEEPATLQGVIDERGLDLDVMATRIALPPLNPYVTASSSYAVSSGAASLRAGVQLAEDALDADLDLTLHDLGLQDQGGTFRKDFGVSLPLGLALLRDVGGDIHLSLPIRRDHMGVDVDLLGTFGNALHGAILNALLSPLKVAGAVVTAGGAVETVAPQPLVYRPGAVAPTGEGAAQVERLAGLLASKPRLGIALRPVWTPADRRALDAPGDPTGEEPGAGGAPATPEALARARVQALRRALVEDYGVGEARVVTVADPAAAEEGDPRIEIELVPLEAAPDPGAPRAGEEAGEGDA